MTPGGSSAAGSGDTTVSCCRNPETLPVVDAEEAHLRRVPSRWRTAGQIARRDLETAEEIAETSPDWAFNIAYNAMHQAGRAFLLHRG